QESVWTATRIPVRRVSSCRDLPARGDVLLTVAARSSSSRRAAAGLDRRDGLGLIHVFRVTAHIETTGELVYKRVGDSDSTAERLAGPRGRGMSIQANRKPRDRLDRSSFFLEQNGSLAVLEPFDPRAAARVSKRFAFRAPEKECGSAGGAEKR